MFIWYVCIYVYVFRSVKILRVRSSLHEWRRESGVESEGEGGRVCRLGWDNREVGGSVSVWEGAGQTTVWVGGEWWGCEGRSRSLRW